MYRTKRKIVERVNTYIWFSVISNKKSYKQKHAFFVPSWRRLFTFCRIRHSFDSQPRLFSSRFLSFQFDEIWSWSALLTFQSELYWIFPKKKKKMNIFSRICKTHITRFVITVHFIHVYNWIKSELVYCKHTFHKNFKY
jgi:hypothetical protein